MSETFIRLSDFATEHSRALNTNKRIAAYDLYEFIEKLTDHYYVKSGPIIPKTVCWLGGVATPQRSSRNYVIDFGMLHRYFRKLAESGAENEPDFECEIDGDFHFVPAHAIYFSKNHFFDWVVSAEIECPRFLTQANSSKCTIPESDIEAFRTKELNKIHNMTAGLVELIAKVNSAYTSSPPSGLTSEQVSNIKKWASRIDLRSAKSNQYSALIELAMAAGLEDFPKSIKTLEKYIG